MTKEAYGHGGDADVRVCGPADTLWANVMYVCGWKVLLSTGWGINNNKNGIKVVYSDNGARLQPEAYSSDMIFLFKLLYLLLEYI